MEIGLVHLITMAEVHIVHTLIKAIALAQIARSVIARVNKQISGATTATDNAKSVCLTYREPQDSHQAPFSGLSFLLQSHQISPWPLTTGMFICYRSPVLEASAPAPRLWCLLPELLPRASILCRELHQDY